MRYDREFRTSRDLLIPVEEARAVVSVPDASLLEAAAVLEEERTAFKISQKHDTALADILLVSVWLADRVPVQGHAEEFVRDEPFWDHSGNMLPDLAVRMVLALLLLLHPAHAVRLALLRGVVSALV